MKRGTPKIPQTGLPGSPSAADMNQNRGSPGSMNLNGQMPPDMTAPFFPGGPNMRPPSSNPAFNGGQMGQPLTANANRVPSGQWQPGQPMPPQHSPATQAGTPQERSNMPPPQAPPTGPNAGRTQPPSPQTTGNAPPTPQQTAKPAPKKKDGKDTRKRPTKKATAAANAAAGATPSTEGAEPPPTPTPSTPVTPHPPTSFKTGANATGGGPAQPTSAPAPQPMAQPSMDQNPQTFNDLSITDPASAFNLDFGPLDNPDILESFDFDTFLNTDADGTGFGFDPNLPYSTDGVETGAAEPM